MSGCGCLELCVLCGGHTAFSRPHVETSTYEFFIQRDRLGQWVDLHRGTRRQCDIWLEAEREAHPGTAFRMVRRTTSQEEVEQRGR